MWEFHVRIHAPRAFPKGKLSEKLPAKLTHIALKKGQGFNAHPACPRQLLTPLLYRHDGFFWPTCRQFVQDRPDYSEVVASLSEQDHLAHTAHLMLVSESDCSLIMSMYLKDLHIQLPAV
jgi:hypothetical protein